MQMMRLQKPAQRPEAGLLPFVIIPEACVKAYYVVQDYAKRLLTFIAANASAEGVASLIITEEAAKTMCQ